MPGSYIALMAVSSPRGDAARIRALEDEVARYRAREVGLNAALTGALAQGARTQEHLSVMVGSVAELQFALDDRDIALKAVGLERDQWLLELAELQTDAEEDADHITDLHGAVRELGKLLGGLRDELQTERMTADVRHGLLVSTLNNLQAAEAKLACAHAVLLAQAEQIELLSRD